VLQDVLVDAGFLYFAAAMRRDTKDALCCGIVLCGTATLDLV
jgi:hypothetical protein